MQQTIVYGAPGCGKTTTLKNIVQKEIEENNVNLIDIAYVSFTKEGANQGKKAVRSVMSQATDAQMKYFKTLHSLAFTALKFNRQMIINKKGYKLFSDKVGMSFTGYYTEELKHNDDLYLFVHDLHRNNPSATKHYVNLIDIHKYNYVKENFKNFKQQFGTFDFTDLIEMFIMKNEILPVKVAVIDEAQDLTTLQWKMVWTAFRNCERVYIAGDDDQAIYQWSGADVDYFLKLKGNVEILSKSYRLPKAILDYSKNISRMITNRVEKEFESTGKIGRVNEIDHIEEITVTKGETWLFLSRNHTFLTGVKEFLSKQGIPYRDCDGYSITESDLNVIRYYETNRKDMVIGDREWVELKLHLKQDFNFNQVWYDAFNWKPEKIEAYRDFFASKNKLEDFMVEVNGKKEYAIKVSTIHSTKGSEANNVVVLLDITKTVYMNLKESPDSEHRVFYVAFTRARNNLFVVNSNSKYEYTVYKN